MFSISKKKYIIALAILSVSTTSVAKEISYDYVEATYGSVTVDAGAGDVDGNGISVSGSFSVAPAIAFEAGYARTNYDKFRGKDLETTALTFGMIAHASISSGTDIYGSLSVIKSDIKASTGSRTIDDDTGNVISIGLRHSATDVIELDAGMARTDIFDDQSNVFFLGARFYAAENFSLAAGYSTGGDVSTLALNARIDF